MQCLCSGFNFLNFLCYLHPDEGLEKLFVPAGRMFASLFSENRNARGLPGDEWTGRGVGWQDVCASGNDWYK